VSSVSTRDETLLLFDIDGTLVRGATEAHRDALFEALARVHGIDAAAHGAVLSPAGRTDGEIARAILLAAGVSADAIDERAEDVAQECARAYAEHPEADLSRFVIAGIPELLSWLGERSDARLALVTGNYEAVARLKLRRAGLGHWFASAPGAFGSDAEDRAALPAIARRRAGTPGDPFPRDRTVVIGDTPRDIACARADGLRCLAVGTGPFTPDELADADMVAADSGELRGALDVLLTGV
jgi:phosphoglycolate phosphatase-like HAD superfamily hydrolase